MTYYASRACTELVEGSPESAAGPAFSIADYRDAPAYVLLGDAGMGKTTTLQKEAEATGGRFVPAYDFIRLEPGPEPESIVYFIDGLDELRTYGADRRTALDAVCDKLRQLSSSGFRLSCRTASWSGSIDRKRLKRVLPDDRVRVLSLTSLSTTDIGKILEADNRIENGQAFLEAAESAGIKDLLSNPLNLGLLAKAWAVNSLPRTRRAMMKWACRKLLEEYNEKHRYSQQHLPDFERQLDRAGYLSALLVLTGSTGYALQRPRPGFLDLPGIPGNFFEVDRRVLDSRLFRATAEGLLEPVHRQYAEYLAARYIADLLKDGLPLGRLASLICGLDGSVQPSFYDLVAWLAELSQSRRRALLALEPVGIVSCADVASFNCSEKLLLLEGILRESGRHPTRQGVVLANHRLGALATTEMAADIIKRLKSLTPSEEYQPQAIVLAEVLFQAAPISMSTDLLLCMVRDGLWSRRVRLRALRAAVHQLGVDTPLACDELAKLADDIRGGRVNDDTDEILGQILPRLYPHTLTPGAIVQFLHTPRAGRSYVAFWAHVVIEQSTLTQQAALLDALVVRHNALHHSDRRTAQTIREVVWILLEHVLPEYATEASTTQLFNWLGAASLALESRTFEFGIFQAEIPIREFLEDNANVRAELANMRTRQNEDASRAGFDPLLFIDVVPQDRRQPLRDASCQREDAPHASMGVAESLGRASGLERDHPWHPAEHVVEFHESTAGEELTNMGRKVLAHVQGSDRGAPAGTPSGMGPIPSAMLHRLAAVYHGIGENARGRMPRQRLWHVLGSNEAVEMVLRQFHDVAFATDLPDEREILRRTKKHTLHLLAFPCLAGFAEKTRGGTIHWKHAAQIRRAVAIYYVTCRLLPNIGGAPPSWFVHILDQHPALVSEVYVRYAAACWASNRLPPAGLTDLVYRKQFSTVARHSVLPLLKKLSVRSSHIHSLEHLLHGALRLVSREDFSGVIASKLASDSMTIAQRVWWLAAGLWTSPETYAGRVKAFANRDQRRIAHLMRAIGLFQHVGMERFSPEVLALLIQLTAPWYSPVPMHNAASRQNAATCISGIIRALRDRPSQAAKDALDQLARDDAVHRWRSEIMDAANLQRELLSWSQFMYPQAAEVAGVLANQAPHNARDLAALTTDALRSLAQHIRTGNTSDWRQYWNVDSYGRTLDPRPESSCRDALASDLAAKLRRWDISVQTEVTHVNDTRADIEVSRASFKIPLEVKRSCSRELWSAIQTQLVTRYCVDPDAHGFGLYIVFWFGNAQQCRPARRDDPQPQSAKELEAMLIDTLVDIDRHRISVVVVDVARPQE